MHQEEREEQSRGEQRWLVIGGQPDQELARALGARVKSRVQGGQFTWEEVRHIAGLEASVVREPLSISAKRLEMLRRLCHVWDIDLHPSEISSHRRFVGPFIVGAKKVLYRLIRVLLKDLIAQQRDFNSAAIALLADLANDTPERREPGE